MDDQFKIIVASDVDYEDLIAEISFDNQIVAVLSQEQGPDAMKIEFNREWIRTSAKQELLLVDFKRAIERAERRLREMKKADNS